MKEKATELVEKFYRITASQPLGEEVEYFKHSIEYFEAKQCALIAVDEMIEFLGELWLKNSIIEKNYRFEMSKLFEEKQEINNL